MKQIPLELCCGYVRREGSATHTRPGGPSPLRGQGYASKREYEPFSNSGKHRHHRAIARIPFGLPPFRQREENLCLVGAVKTRLSA
jgi:hypothetical protein